MKHPAEDLGDNDGKTLEQDMNDKRKVAIAKILWAICLVSVAAQVTMWIFILLERPSQFDLGEALSWGLVIPLAFSIPALLIITRQPGNWVGWLMMVVALFAVNPVSVYLGYLTNIPTTITPGWWLLLWSDGWSWVPAIFPFFLIPLHFPSGRPPSPRWNWVNYLAIGMWLFFILLAAFTGEMGPLNADWVVPNPIGFIPIEVVEGSFLIVWGIGLVTVASASVISLFVRYRRAQSAERQQIKWLLYAGAFFVVTYTLEYFLSGADQFGTVSWLGSLFVLSILAFPIAITIAILRYRLYDIDVIIRKTLVYALVSGMLILAYFGSVVVLQSLFSARTGESSPIAIVVSTLLIAALFNPLRRRVQEVIDRRFYRRRYDAQQVLAAFAQIARDEVDLDALMAELVHTVQETMQPEQMSLWLKPGASRRSIPPSQDIG